MQAQGRGRDGREGTAHGVTVPLTDSFEPSFRFSKGACLSFVETETAGYHSQMQSSTTKGKLIAWPSSDKQRREKEQRDSVREGEGCTVGSISIPALNLTLTADTDPVSKVSRRHGTGSRNPQEANAVCFYAVLCFFCGCSSVVSKCHSSVTHVDNFDPVTPQPYLSLVP